jgi:hypothetical protein
MAVTCPLRKDPYVRNYRIRLLRASNAWRKLHASSCFQTQANCRLRISQQSSDLVQSSDAVTPSGHSLPSAFGHCGLPIRLTASAPWTHDFAAQVSPANASPYTSRCAAHDSGSRCFAITSLVGTCHSTASLVGALNAPRTPHSKRPADPGCCAPDSRYCCLLC